MKHVLDWNEYSKTAVEAIAEGCVLLKNDNQVLPLKKGAKVSVFGRIQTNYYKSGTGSGGKVNVAKVYGIPEGLEAQGIILNKNLCKIYEACSLRCAGNLSRTIGAARFSDMESVFGPNREIITI